MTTTTTRPGRERAARRAVRSGRPLLGAACLALVLTACGSNGGRDAGEDAGATASDKASAQDAMLDFAQCMRDNGVPMEDPEPGGGVMINGKEADPEAVQAAQEECGHLLEGALPDESEMGISAEDKEALLAQAVCMRERGWDVPDPEFDGGRVMMQLDEDVDPSDPSFRADQEACADEAGLELPPMREGGE